MIPVILATLSAVFAGVSWLMLMRTLAARTTCLRLHRQMERERAFILWAKWTTLTIVNDGQVTYTNTLWNLRNEPSVLVWKEPEAVSLFQGAPVESEHFEGDPVNGRPRTSPGRGTAGTLPVRRPQESGHQRAGAKGAHGAPGETVLPEG